jgi:hypothetical protein
MASAEELNDPRWVVLLDAEDNEPITTTEE